MSFPALWQTDRSHITLLTAAAAAAGDQYAIARHDTAQTLMWRAAGHLARTVITPKLSGYGRRIVILVGKGNNGGDGYAAALRLTTEHGAQVTVVALDGVDVAMSPEAAAFRAAWCARGRPVITDVVQACTALGRADVVVDALLGTGTSGPLRGSVMTAVTLLADAAKAGAEIVACDVPTGVDVNTGAVAEGAVAADRTVTFGGMKQGLMLAPAAALCGAVRVGPLGDAWDTFLATHSGQAAMALTAYGARPEPYTWDVDKWRRGRVAVIGGVTGTAGAATLAAHGALHAGAGLVHVCASEAVAHELASTLQPEVILRRVAPTDVTGDNLPVASWVEQLTKETHDVVVAGPGLGVSGRARELVIALLAAVPRLVLDADALNVLRDDPDRLNRSFGELVLTPHRKELARIGGGDNPDEAWQHRIDRVPKLAVRYNATIVAKGPSTVIAAPDGRVWVTPVGSPAAGTGGSGDVLAGIIAAAVATAIDVPLQVAKAVWWHARASEHAGAARLGRATASGLLHELGRVFTELDRPVTTL